MLSNRFALAALAAACVSAAAGGGYLAVRHAVAPGPQVAPAPTSIADTTTTSQPVQETEGRLGDPAPDTSAAPQPSAEEPAAPTPGPKREESPRSFAEKPGSSDAARPKAKTPAPVDRAPVASSTPAPSVPVPAPTVQAPPSLPSPQETTTASPARAENEPSRSAEPVEAQRTMQEIVVPAESVIGLQVESPVSSERARVEDRVDARVTRDVRSNGRVAIPAGSRAVGSVTLVERGGKFKERARLGVRFHTLVLADGTRLPISTDTVYREGDPPGGEASKKIGGAAVGGAILGAILGGARGAAIGATAGAGAGGAVVAAGDRNAATLSAGTPMTVRLMSPVTVTIEEK